MYMHQNQQETPQDGWVEVKCLGAGGFGTVVLWENKVMKEQIAIKKCRLDLNPRNRQRWQQEVDILKRLDHTNIVKAKEVPAALDVPEGELPLMAMEYCSGGDLRKILNSPENICGIRESSVINVAADIACAIQFLHSIRIIHRDLKPENVVISYESGKVIYKLIDLGYAKQLDQGSMATTFVGTLKYLAPELLAGNGSYSKTVDYWSLGTVLFECITGKRPFPDLSPVHWHKVIGLKSTKDIHAYYDVSDELKFSDSFPYPNSLSKCFQDKFASLLQLLLLWDAKQRGGQVKENGSPECYILLQDIVYTKVIHIFCVFTCTLLTYEVTQNDKLDDINVKIYEDTGIAAEDQEIITSAGEEVSMDSTMLDFINTDDDPQSFLFLISKSEIPRSPRPLFTLPSTIKSIVTESKTLLSYPVASVWCTLLQHLGNGLTFHMLSKLTDPIPEQKRVHADALTFCQEQVGSYQNLMQAHRSILKQMLKLNSKLNQLRSTLSSDCIKLEERLEFCRESLDTDKECYSDVVVDIQGNEKLLKSWKEAEKTYFVFDKSNVTSVEMIALKVHAQVLEIQKIPFNQSQTTNPMQELYVAARQVYEDLKQRNLSCYDQKMADCSKIAEVVVKCLTKREKAVKDMFVHLRRILQCTRQIQVILPKVEEETRKIWRHKGLVTQIQKQRQYDIWSLINQKTQFDHVTTATRYSLESYDSGSEDSSELMQQSYRSMEKFSGLFQSIRMEHNPVTPQKLDWSFLDVDNGPHNKEENS